MRCPTASHLHSEGNETPWVQTSAGLSVPSFQEKAYPLQDLPRLHQRRVFGKTDKKASPKTERENSH